jgi:AcrR family transcriptional regulator
MARAEARERIMGATVRTLATEGYSGTTARAIARTGGFAPGVIYYHFTDLDELFARTLHFSSQARLARYRAETDGVTSAVELVRRLRLLYAEDNAEGHIAAVQELVAAAAASSGLADQVRVQVAAWQDLAEETIGQMLEGLPFAGIVPTPAMGALVVGAYLGLETLSHLDALRIGPDALFDAAEGVAALVDLVRGGSGLN